MTQDEHGSSRKSRLRSTCEAGAIYFVVVFAFAFLLGAIRVSFLAPAVGAFWATLIELPFTLTVAWFAAGWIVRNRGVAAGAPAILMGVTAFTVLMIAEAALALAFGRDLAGYLASFLTAPGALGLTGQIAFGLLPVIQARRPSDDPHL